MTSGIPLPGSMIDSLLNGVKTGSGFYTGMMHPILEREKQKQEAELQREKQKQLEAHFQAQLGLSKAAAGRAAQAASDAHRIALNKLDPTYEARQYEALENYLRNRGAPSGGQQAPNDQMPQIPQEPQPTQEMGQGLGAFSPEGMQQAQQPMQQQMQQPATTPNLGGPDLELMKAHPMLRGWYKHHYGVDPLAAVPQTPEQKQAAALDMFKKKEEYKARQEPKLPAAIKTLHENIIHLSPKAIDAIEHIIKIPSPFEPWGLGAIQSGQKAAHNKAVTAAAENYSKAKGWPNTKGSIEKAESILQRGRFETDYDYRKRLHEYQDELRSGITTSKEFLHPNKQSKESESQDESSNNVIEYVRINGKLVPKNR